MPAWMRLRMPRTNTAAEVQMYRPTPTLGADPIDREPGQAIEGAVRRIYPDDARVTDVLPGVPARSGPRQRA
jgi:hypothetical protein